MQVEIDEELLKEIAKVTGGQYFRATNNRSKEIYKEIDQLEKTEIEEFKFYNYDEKYRIFLIMALGFLVIEFILGNQHCLEVLFNVSIRGKNMVLGVAISPYCGLIHLLLFLWKRKTQVVLLIKLANKTYPHNPYLNPLSSFL